jgi:hypothetical protein
MRLEGIVVVRKKAENAVADMDAGPLQIAAFQKILSHLLQKAPGGGVVGSPNAFTSAIRKRRLNGKRANGTTPRLLSLITEGVFSQSRSLAEIRQALSERGWQYQPEDLGTPLTRLVQGGYLRRTQEPSGGKKLWKYCTA